MKHWQKPKGGNVTWSSADPRARATSANCMLSSEGRPACRSWYLDCCSSVMRSTLWRLLMTSSWAVCKGNKIAHRTKHPFQCCLLKIMTFRCMCTSSGPPPAHAAKNPGLQSGSAVSHVCLGSSLSLIPVLSQPLPVPSAPAGPEPCWNAPATTS